MTSLEQSLNRLGLGKNESIVYLALFESGRTKAKELIARTGLHRNLVYTALTELEKEKLVAKFYKKKVAYFEANDPSALLKKLNAQRMVAEEVVTELKQKQKAASHEIKVYEGYDGIIETRRAVMELKNGETGYVFGGSEMMYADELSKKWAPHSQKRMAKGITLKMLCDSTVPDGYIERKNGQPHTSIKRMPMDVPLPALFEVYGNVLNIAVPGKEPVVFSIKSKEAAEAMKKFFEFFWN